MDFTNYEDKLLVDTVLELEDKCLYTGRDFWSKIRLKMRFDMNVPERNCNVLEKRFNYLYSLGYEMKSNEEKYYDIFGEYYDDYKVPSYEEDMMDNIDYNDNEENYESEEN